MPKPLLLGHRGARACRAISENTIPSFDLTLKHGCDGFEFDVRLSGSGTPVICHDDQVGGMRVTDPNFDDQSAVPNLTDVLARYAQRAFLDIELKVTGLDSELLIALKSNPPQRGYVVSSFLPEALTDLRMRDGHIPLGFICDRKKDLELWRDLPIQYVIPHYTLVSSKLIEQVHTNAKMLVTWTVNDRTSMFRLAEWGVDGIISDETELMVKTFAKTR